MNKALDYNKEGLAFYDKNEFGKALELFKKAAAEDPDNSTYVYNIGCAYTKMAAIDHANVRSEAKEYLLKAESMGKVLACFVLGEVFDPCLYKDFAPSANGDKAMAYYRRYLEECQEDRSDAPTALNNIGCIFGMEKKKYFEACCYVHAAAAMGLAMGRKNFDYFKEHLTPLEREEAEKIRSFEDILKLFPAGSDSAASGGGAFSQGGTSGPGKEDHRTLEERMAELNELVGLTEVKKEVSSLINLLQVAKLRKERGMKVMPVSLHLVFTGNPGTGKTTVARMLAGIYRELGVLSKGQLIEVDRSELVAGYVGQTAIKTQDKIDEAKGGILFIDEAYTLIKEGNDFGQEAVDTLLKEMEDNRDNLVVIVAGYTDLMEKFLNSNPGLRSRFNKFIHFKDYSIDELFRIFLSMCNKSGYKLARSAKGVVKNDFARMIELEGDHFANGRSVRNYFEAAVVNQANRLASRKDVSDDDLITLKVADFKGILEESKG